MMTLTRWGIGYPIGFSIGAYIHVQLGGTTAENAIISVVAFTLGVLAKNVGDRLLAPILQEGAKR
jgi:hypothetical protein